MQVFDTAGNPVKVFNGLEPLWLDSNTVEAFHVDDYPPQGPSGQFYSVPGMAVDVTNRTLEQVSLPCCLPMSSGHGAVAVMRRFPDPGFFLPTFVVWQGGHASPEHDGYPLGWDAAGDKLVVLHSLQPVDIDPFFDPRGWLEVLSWPVLQTLYANKSKGDIGDATFDPTGNYVDYSSVTRDASGAWNLHIDIIDLATGSVANVAVAGDSTGVGDYLWNDQSQILTFIGADTVVTTYAPDGTKVGQHKGTPKSSYEASADGTTLVSTQAGPNGFSTPVIAYRDGASALLQPPAEVHNFLISPDGRQILITVGSPTGETAYLAKVPL